MENKETIEEYWRAKASSLGETISDKSIAQMYRGDEPERLGIVFLTDKHLCFEYNLNPRRGILDSILRRDLGQVKEQTLMIPLSTLKTVGMVTPAVAKRWARRAAAPAELSALIPARAPSLLTALLLGTCLAVCTEDSYLALNTPRNGEWLKKLTGR